MQTSFPSIVAALVPTEVVAGVHDDTVTEDMAAAEDKYHMLPYNMPEVLPCVGTAYNMSAQPCLATRID